MGDQTTDCSMDDTRKVPRLSKSKFISGLQCQKRLHLEIYQPYLATPPDAGTQAILDMGTEVGELARRRFPEGRLVTAGYRQSEAALAQTAAPMMMGTATGEVRRIEHQARTHLVGNRTKRCEIHEPGVGRCATDDHFWPMLHSQRTNFVVVNELSILSDAIGHHVEPLATEVHFGTVCQVAAVGQ